MNEVVRLKHVFYFFYDRPRQAFHADAEPPAEAKITSATTFVYDGDIQVDVSKRKKRKKRKRKDGEGRRRRYFPRTSYALKSLPIEVAILTVAPVAPASINVPYLQIVGMFQHHLAKKKERTNHT